MFDRLHIKFKTIAKGLLCLALKVLFRTSLQSSTVQNSISDGHDEKLALYPSPCTGGYRRKQCTTTGIRAHILHSTVGPLLLWLEVCWNRIETVYCTTGVVETPLSFNLLGLRTPYHHTLLASTSGFSNKPQGVYTRILLSYPFQQHNNSRVRKVHFE